MHISLLLDMKTLDSRFYSVACAYSDRDAQADCDGSTIHSIRKISQLNAFRQHNKATFYQNLKVLNAQLTHTVHRRRSLPSASILPANRSILQQQIDRSQPAVQMYIA
jgi:hypothetical protein